jgi:hypothetical protein
MLTPSFDHDMFRTHERGEHVNSAISCSDLMKYAVRSEFAGDLVTARAWISAVAQAETENYELTPAGKEYESSKQFKLIACSMQGNREESTKRLRDAILLAEKLRWRCGAFKCLSSGSCVNAERASTCADVVAECLHRLLSCHDKAEVSLLEAAVAAAEPRLLQFYLDAEVQVTSSLVGEVEELLRRSTRIDYHRREVASNIEELATLVAQRDEYQVPRLIDVYDEFIAASRADITHSIERLEKLEAGDLHIPGKWVGNWDSAQHFFRGKLRVVKPVVQQLEIIAQKVAELHKSSDKLAQLEVRCWAGVVGHLNSTLGRVLSTPYSCDTAYHDFSVGNCLGAQLRIMVVESLIGAAKQYQSEMRSEGRPEVMLLLRNAAQWAQTCAEKTFDSIEALPIQSKVIGNARAKWSSCYHEASDRCAMLYARAAAELRASCNRARSHHAHCHLRATVYRIASEASVREADVVVQQDLSSEESRQQQSTASEINELSVCLAEGLPVLCDPGAVETFGDFARRVLEDPAGVEVNLLAARQAHDALMAGTPVS